MTSFAGSYLSYGNFIAASAAYMAFNWNLNGNSLAVLPIGAKGRQNHDVPLIHCGSDFVTDFQFSPFDDGLLATGSNDTTVRQHQFTHEVFDFSRQILSYLITSKP